jgi:hypothetical protein
MASNPRLLIWRLLAGTSWTWSDGVTKGIGPGISIVADDNATVLTPSMLIPQTGGQGISMKQKWDPRNNQTNEQNLIQIWFHPYAQEGSGYRPQVIIGPTRPISTKNITIGSQPLIEIHRKVEVRVVTRDWDSGELGFTLDGDNTRNKIDTQIRTIIENNLSNPDGTGQFWYALPLDPSPQSDTVASPEPIPLYVTANQIEVAWFEGPSVLPLPSIVKV